MQATFLAITNIFKCLCGLLFFTSFGKFASSTSHKRNPTNSMWINQHSFGLGSSFSNGAGADSIMIPGKEFNSLDLIKQIDT